jgi:hypothetical protein
MTSLEEIEHIVRDRVPDAVTEYLPPYHPTGNHDLRITVDGKFMSIRWREDIRYWVDGGDDPDGVLDAVDGLVQLDTADAALRYVLELIGERRANADAR